LEEGTRVGRYVVLRDTSGTLHAVSSAAVSALCEADDGTILLLPGGRMIALAQSLRIVLAWFETRG
jgi:hypothetical protein